MYHHCIFTCTPPTLTLAEVHRRLWQNDILIILCTSCPLRTSPENGHGEVRCWHGWILISPPQPCVLMDFGTCLAESSPVDMPLSFQALRLIDSPRQ